MSLFLHDQGSVDDNHQVSHGKSDIIGKAEEMRVDDGVDDGVVTMAVFIIITRYPVGNPRPYAKRYFFPQRPGLIAANSNALNFFHDLSIEG